MKSNFWKTLQQGKPSKLARHAFFSTHKKDIDTHIIIQAPAKKVWNVLTDFSRYHEWNPLLTRVEGNFSVGERLNVSARLKSIPVFFSPTIISIVPDKEFTWRGDLLSKEIFHGTHRLAIEEISPEHTAFIHSEYYGSSLFKFIFPMVAKISLPAFLEMNEALKHRCEETSLTPDFIHKKLV